MKKTINEIVAEKTADAMTVEQLRQYVYEDLLALHDHDSGEMLENNFFDLPTDQQMEILREYPKFRPTIGVEFTAQTWVNDYALEVDALGETTWEVEYKDVIGIEPDSYEADHLRYDQNAPEWVKKWSGPFRIDW